MSPSEAIEKYSTPITLEMQTDKTDSEARAVLRAFASVTEPDDTAKAAIDIENFFAEREPVAVTRLGRPEEEQTRLDKHSLQRQPEPVVSAKLQADVLDYFTRLTCED